MGAVLLAGCYVGDYQEQPRVHRRPAPDPVVVERPEPVVVERVEVDQPPDAVVAAFYDDLSPYGRWVVIENYGRCWSPNGVDRGWRPYTVGHWVQSDRGLTWVSEEPWGHATYHYGRWFEAPRYGWCWMPGSTWSPAWVAWRSGGGYVGWAPLGPSIRDRDDVRITEVETREVPSSHYCFVEERRIAEPRIRE